MTRERTIPAGTRTGLNRTRTGVARIRDITVPVKVNPDKPRNAAPIVAAVRNLTAWRMFGDWSWSDLWEAVVVDL